MPWKSILKWMRYYCGYLFKCCNRKDRQKEPAARKLVSFCFVSNGQLVRLRILILRCDPSSLHMEKETLRIRQTLPRLILVFLILGLINQNRGVRSSTQIHERGNAKLQIDKNLASNKLLFWMYNQLIKNHKRRIYIISLVGNRIKIPVISKTNLHFDWWILHRYFKKIYW